MQNRLKTTVKMSQFGEIRAILAEPNTYASNTYQRLVIPNLLQYACKNRSKDLFNNVTIVAGNNTICANKMVLSCCSQVFEKMFKSKIKERYENTITLSTDIHGNAISAAINFMYSGSTNLSNQHVMQVLAASDYLQVEDLKQLCVKHLSCNISTATCFDVLSASNLYEIKTLRTQVCEFISAKFEDLYPTEEFKDLSKIDLMFCLSHLYQNYNIDETIICQAIIDWVIFKLATREKDFSDLIPLVDLSKLSAIYLSEFSSESFVVGGLACSNALLSAFLKIHSIPHAEHTEHKIFSFGGSKTATEVIKIYNPSKKGNELVHLEMPTKLSYCSVTTLLGLTYCLGGKNITKNNQQLLQIKVNTGSDIVECEEKAPMICKRSARVSAVFCDTIVVTGGKANSKWLLSTECYLPQLDEWKELADVNNPKVNNALVACNGYLYDVGGWDGSRCLPYVECLNGLKEEWNEVSVMQTDRACHGVVDLDGYIYAIGGRSGIIGCNSTLASVEKYDPVVDSWVFVGSMKNARRGHAACVFHGKIFVVGGRNQNNGFVDDIECYDPSRDVWTVVGKTSTGLTYHSLIVM